MIPYEILQHYYGNDINIIFNAPVADVPLSYPGRPLRIGSVGEEVRIIKRQLNRIGENYPAIPKIPELNGYFNRQTEDAVKAFQKIFNLEVDGVVGKATWYKIKSIYNGIKRLNELYSEGLTPEEVERFYPEVLREGDTGRYVQEMQLILAVIAFFDNQIPLPSVNGVFDAPTRESLMAFQRQYGLTPDGVLGRNSSNKLIEVYRDTVANVPFDAVPDSSFLYPGRYVLQGMRGDEVRDLQNLINLAAQTQDYIPTLHVDGIFGSNTESAVRAIQQHEGLEVNGIVGPITWNSALPHFCRCLSRGEMVYFFQGERLKHEDVYCRLRRKWKINACAAAFRADRRALRAPRRRRVRAGQHGPGGQPQAPGGRAGAAVSRNSGRGFSHRGYRAGDV